jgi:hypothetical protein
MAARGTRNLDAGEESLEDQNLIERLRARAKGIHRRAFITAIIITLVAVVFPNP